MACFLPRGFVRFTVAAALASVARGFEVSNVEAPPKLVSLDMHVGGRTVVTKADHGATMYRFQWPGVYFIAAFDGPEVYFESGTGRAMYHVLVDSAAASDSPEWTNAGPGFHRISGLGAGEHQIRFELATECQGGPVDFGGFFVRDPANARTVSAVKRQIEFIGDSHTVGYGDTSSKRQCTADEIWSTTDTSQALGSLVAKHYQAEYRVNAISGRGIIRNYGGFAGDPLPVVYPFALFDKKQPADDRGWNPQIIVIGLGTNDFSTPLKPEEKWKTRDDEHADYERTYVQFVQSLRAKHPGAFFILAANDGYDGEIQAEVRKVIAQLAAVGESRVGYVSYNHMELTACDWHPSLADQRLMAAALIDFIDSHHVWAGH